jgi:hypothetical protein
VSADRDRSAAVMVVRAWRDGPGPDGLRARIWRAVGRGADPPLTEHAVGSLTELEQSVGEGLDRVAADESTPSGSSASPSAS